MSVTAAKLLDGMHKQKVRDFVNHPLSPPDSDDEYIDVHSRMSTPNLSAYPSRSTSPKPGKRTATRPSPLGPNADVLPRKLAALSLLDGSRDPLRLLPDRVRPFIFCSLSAKDLATCSLVCQRWKRSQVINHAWYQLYRQETYQGSDLPVGKWTKRESKKDWRAGYLQTRRQRYKEESSAHFGAYNLSRPVSRPVTRPHSPTPGSGYQTPREIKEEQWRLEEEAIVKPPKLAMREHYKDMGGRKARGKNKLGMQGGVRDRTAHVEEMGWYGE